MKQLSALEVGLVVSDLETMLSFYTDVLGCSEVRRSDIPPALSSGIAVHPDGYVNVWLQTPNGEVIKLVAPTHTDGDGPSNPGHPAFSAERTGFGYLTFYCAEIEQVLTKAEGAGAHVRSDRSYLAGEIGVKMVFFEDPEGNVIELVEPV